MKLVRRCTDLLIPHMILIMLPNYLKIDELLLQNCMQITQLVQYLMGKSITHFLEPLFKNGLSEN